ncbi:glycosyltransferase family 9 protein [bacterium]|nr:glycosyltransferase family 9 protein [bacterium]
MNSYDKKSILGDQLPPPPENKTVPDASSIKGRFVFGARKYLLKALYSRKTETTVPPPPSSVKKLLVVQHERLGDFVVAEPALRALRDTFEYSARTLIAPGFASHLLEGYGWGEVKPLNFLNNLEDNPDSFDLVIDLTGRLEIDIAKQLFKSKIKYRIGLDRGGRGVFFTHPVENPEIIVPTREMYTILTGKASAVPDDLIPRLPCGDERIERGTQAWSDLGAASPVVIMPGAHYPEQRWSVAKFSRSAQSLKSLGLKVIVICGPGEEGLGGAIAQDVGIPLIVAPPINKLMDYLATASLVICNNTGTLHLSAALNTPTISTMGPTIPWKWWPVSDAETVVFRGGSKESKGRLDRIMPEHIVAAALQMLGIQNREPAE